MSKRIFVSATNTNIGKTYTSLRLIDAFSRLGYRVGVFKPIETGVVSYPEDGKILFESALRSNPLLSSLRLNDIVPIQFLLPSAPFVANGGNPIELTQFDQSLEKIESLCDIVIIEGAGGLMVPIDDETMMIDLARYFQATVFLVTHCSLGCINDTLLSLKALDDAKLAYIWGMNCRESDRDFENVSLPYLNHRFERLFRIHKDIDAIAKALLDTISRHNEESA